MDKKCTLLLTACIKPTATKIHAKNRKDPLVRLKDYEVTLNYWLNYSKLVFTGIVFIENSGFDLSSLKRIVEENNPSNIKIEFLQQQASIIPDGLNYGYSELEMIDYAFENSRIIAQSEYIIKSTGRLYFPKLAKLIARLPDDFKIAIDSRDYEMFHVQKHYLVTTIFIVQKLFYNQGLNNAKSLMEPGYKSYIERIYFQILKPMYLNKQAGIILRLPFSMNPVGFGAHWNVNYNSWNKRLAAAVRDLIRVVLPSFWI